MTSVLALVPTLNREHLASQPLGGRLLFEWALNAVGAYPQVALVGDESLELSPRAARPDRLTYLLPRDEVTLRSAIHCADLVIVHDPLCPLVSAAFVADVVHAWEALTSEAEWTAVVAVRPVVDTLKSLRGNVVVDTIDRDAVWRVVSPVVASAALLSGTADLAATLSDPSSLVEELRRRGPVAWMAAPESARRVEGSVSLLGLATELDDLPG
ncbi:MAG: 2-C-methyl-D-erythritol 4-phosphate cytidylyltransferase [Nocardioidaceae bacterium]